MGKIADRKPLILAIKKKLLETELPKEFMLEDWAKATNTNKFFEVHLTSLINSSDKASKPYADRLKKGLKIIGIDINEIAKQLKKTKNK